VLGLDWSNDSENYTGGSVATGRTAHVGQVRGDDPYKKRQAGPSCSGLGVGLTILTQKKICLFRPPSMNKYLFRDLET